ncbi:MAG: multidrug resistance protein [Rhizobium sp.]|nr:multidrug resistance protein [Rhizobium sp.]
MNVQITNLKLPDLPDAREVSPAASVAGANPQKRRKARNATAGIMRATVIVAAIGLAVVVPLGWGQWLAGMTDQATDDAYLRADSTPISTEVSGRVKAVLVADFQRVKAGDILARIDDRDYAAQVARASAMVDAARATIRNADSQIRLQEKVIAQVEAAVSAVEADRDKVNSEYARQQRGAREKWSSVQALEAATADVKRLEAQTLEKRTEVDAQRQRTDVLRTQKQQAEAELASQQAALDIARVNLDRTTIVSPINGFVSASNVRAGQYLPVGSRITTVVPLPHVYVLANYKETQLGKVRVGQMVTLTVDMFPGRILRGHVANISPATGSEFALLPPDNATGNFTKVAQRVSVRVELDDSDGLAELLRPGMSVVPTIHTDQMVASKE